MRLFIAINLGKDTNSRLLALRDELRSHSQAGKFIAPENLHLTLAFLGECNAAQIAAAKEAMTAVCVDPFDFIIDRVGRFKKYGGDVWLAGIRESRELLDLKRSLSERLITAGFTLESRKYSPHITIGREVVTEYLFGKIQPFGETVSTIDLMKSERINGKLTYTSILRRG